jgi:hypothetical protein
MRSALPFRQNQRDFNNQEMQRELLSRKIRSRKRALDIADRLDQKVAEAIELLEIQRPVRLAKGVQPPVDESGKPLPLGQELAITPLELVNMFRASQEVQHRILGQRTDLRIPLSLRRLRSKLRS